jgi:hypothetical protein
MSVEADLYLCYIHTILLDLIGKDACAIYSHSAVTLLITPSCFLVGNTHLDHIYFPTTQTPFVSMAMQHLFTMNSPMWFCDFHQCNRPAVRILGDCVICDKHLCSTHLQKPFHTCPTPEVLSLLHDYPGDLD